MDNTFKLIHCQKDYETNTITIQFIGKFDAVKALEYLKQNYPSFEGKVVAFSEPSNFRGLENVGEAVFKHYP